MRTAALLMLACLAAPVAAQSPFDALDATSIPTEERFAGQPRDLVAVLGSNRGRMWEPIASLAVSPDGKVLACGGQYGGVRLFDAATLVELRAFRACKQPVLALVFTPDGKTLVTASGQPHPDSPGYIKGEIRWWDAATGKERGTVTGHGSIVRTLAFSSDGTWLVSGGHDGSVLLWEWHQGAPKLAVELKDHRAAVVTASFAADGTTLVTADGNQDLCWWDAKSGKARERPAGVGRDWYAAFSADGKLLLRWGYDNKVELYTWQAGKAAERAELVLPDRPHHVVADRDGGRLAAVDAKGTIHLWDLSAPRPKAVGTLKAAGQGRNVRIALAADGRALFAAGNLDYGVRRWDVSGAEPRELPLPPGPRAALLAVVWSADGRHIVAAGEEEQAWRWAWDGKRFAAGVSWVVAVHKRTLVRPSVEALALTADGKTLATGSGRTVRLWDLTAWPPVLKATVIDDREEVDLPWASLAFAPDGTALATAFAGPMARTLDLRGDEPKERRLLKNPGASVMVLAFAPDGKTLAVGGRDGVVHCFEAATGMKRWSAETTSGVVSLAYSPDGRTLAMGGDDGRIALWETLARKRRAVLESQSGAVNAVAFSPDSRRLAAAHAAGEVSVWAGGEKVWSIRLPGTVTGVAWAPDGRHLATANANGTVYIFRVPN
jgi:WD40 repeat protein